MTISENVSVGIKDILITFLEIKTHEIDAYTPPYDPGAEILVKVKKTCQIRDSAGVFSTQTIKLPFEVVAFDDDAIYVINKDFEEIQRHLLAFQKYMNSKGYNSLSVPTKSTENIVLYGLDSNKPINVTGRDGRYFYWATDKRKLYALFPLKREPSPKVSVAISGIDAIFTKVFYTTASIGPENISASLNVSISFTSV
jgi:hypothetical protein